MSATRKKCAIQSYRGGTKVSKIPQDLLIVNRRLKPTDSDLIDFRFPSKFEPLESTVLIHLITPKIS